MKNYDNADLGIVCLMMIAVAALVTGHTDAGLLTAAVAGISGVARGNGSGNGPSSGG